MPARESDPRVVVAGLVVNLIVLVLLAAGLLAAHGWK